MTNKDTIKNAINYLSIYATKSENFNDIKFIDTSIDNPLKVSYIKQDKIQSLLEYTGTKIKGTKEQRKKYFTSTSISKILSKMFIDEGERQATISTDIDTQLRKNYCKNVELFIENDVSGFYSQENENYIYNPNGSCMSKKPISYFEIYDNFINTKTQIVGLKVGKSVVARAVLWTKTNKKDIICEDSGKVKETKETKSYFLDRIYISNEFQNSNQNDLQNTLYNRVKRALKLRVLDCYSLTHIKAIYNDCADNVREKINYGNSVNYPTFSIQINKDTFFNLEHCPYMDSFRWGVERSNNLVFDADEDNAEIILECTQGGYTEGNRSECECCGDYYNEDEMHYSDTEEEMLCENCTTYIEERDDVVRSDNALYNNYTGNYHYYNDIEN